MATIYNRETGEAMQCASIDAREILEASPDLYSASPVAVEGSAEAVEPDAAEAVSAALEGDANGDGHLSEKEIKADLDRLGIKYHHNAKWPTLNKLLREGKAAREAAVNASVGE